MVAGSSPVRVDLNAVNAQADGRAAYETKILMPTWMPEISAGHRRQMYINNEQRRTMSEYETKYDSRGMPNPNKDYVEVTVRLPKPADGYEWVPDAKYNVADCFKLKPARKLLDWSKVGQDVLVSVKEYPGYYPKRGGLLTPVSIFDGWQAHLGGECPVDPDACMVDVRFRNGMGYEGTASNWAWTARGIDGDIIAYRVTGLAPGYEYP